MERSGRGRDVSLGVAKRARGKENVEGKINRNTGALSRRDGLTVANVLLSPARLRIVVYSSVLPREINLAAMTPGMFVVTSTLRMATVVAAPVLVGPGSERRSAS